MANWCSNMVEFIGEHNQFEQLGALVNEMASKEKETKEGQLPSFAQGERGYMFDIRWEEGILYYETRWSPNVAVIVKIAQHLKVAFVYSYSEPGNMVYGEAIYMHGRLTNVSLDWNETDSFYYDDEKGLYEFEGKEFESDDEIKEILLKRKKEAITNSPDSTAKNNN